MLALRFFIFGIVLQYKISHAGSSTTSIRESEAFKTTSIRESEAFKTTSIRESEAFKMAEKAMLRSMGLKARPRPKRGVKVPQFMIDLYNSDSEHPEWISTRFRFANKWTSVNTIRAFHHQDDLTQSRQAGKSLIKFDLTSFPNHEAVHSAELRLFTPDAWKNANTTHVRIKLYRVTKTAWQTEPTNILIDSRIHNVSRNGWQTFNVRSAVDHWIRNPLNNYGLEVHVTSNNGVPMNVSASDLTTRTQDLNGEKPLLVAYAHDSKNHHHVRKKRSAHTSRKRKRPQYCRRHALAVDFSDVGWNDWIVAPRGYDSFYCAGECPYPITKHLNGTNHAIVQTIMKGVNPDVPQVCCIPTTLSPINMLYMDASDKVVLKKYKEMVVEGCGCR